ncbi:MAG TPA: hypothetical protein VJT31_37670 [Rugosimonospora sp.]|nr:hypothetical protein [Rugosimonospora sp.]
MPTAPHRAAAAGPSQAHPAAGESIAIPSPHLTIEFDTDAPALTPEAARALLALLLHGREATTGDEPGRDQEPAA